MLSFLSCFVTFHTVYCDLNALLVADNFWCFHCTNPEFLQLELASTEHKCHDNTNGAQLIEIML